MYSLALRMALRDWRKVLLIGLVLAFAGSMFIYYNTVMYEMRHYAPNSMINEEDDRFEGMRIPRTKSEQLVAGMTMLVVLAATLFQLNMLIVDMINKKKEYHALEVIGVSQEHVELFPLLYSMAAAFFSAILMIIFWRGIFPQLQHITNIHYVNSGMLLIVVVVFFVMSIIIGVKARDLANLMH